MDIIIMEVIEETRPPPKAEPISAVKEGEGVIFGGVYH